MAQDLVCWPNFNHTRVFEYVLLCFYGLPREETGKSGWKTHVGGLSSEVLYALNTSKNKSDNTVPYVTIKSYLNMTVSCYKYNNILLK